MSGSLDVAMLAIVRPIIMHYRLSKIAIGPAQHYIATTTLLGKSIWTKGCHNGLGPFHMGKMLDLSVASVYYSSRRRSQVGNAFHPINRHTFSTEYHK